MDFTNRAGRPLQPNQSPNTASRGTDNDNKKTKGASMPFSNIATALLLVCAAIVVLGVTSLLIFTKNPSESKNVKEDNLQAVFLNGGQVYFGNITSLNNQYMRLNNIYYLRVNQQVQPKDANSKASPSNDISLVKLGCELHGPEDQMIIKQDQVIFWENLKEDGQVSKAVKKFVEENPDGQNCSNNNQTQNNSTNKAEE